MPSFIQRLAWDLDFVAVDPARGHVPVDIVASAEAWIGAIERALADDAPALAARRRDLARKSDWDKRVDLLETWLREMVWG